MQSNRTVYRIQGSIKVRIGVKDIQLGEKLRYGLIITNENVQILDLMHEDVCAVIKTMAYPRAARLSKCQRFVVAYFTDNTVGIYSTSDGSQISKILGIPRSSNSFVISGNSKRLLFANNQTLCLWSIPKGELEITSNQWRNINCYAIRDDGKQIAIGTYSGAILILTLLTNQRVTQMQLKRHKNCVMMIGYCQNGKVISLSYDKYFITTTMTELPNGEKGISYDEVIMQSIPKFIQSVKNVVFFGENDGSLGWITKGNKLVQYSDGLYGVTEFQTFFVFIRYKEGVIEWFKSQP